MSEDEVTALFHYQGNFLKNTNNQKKWELFKNQYGSFIKHVTHIQTKVSTIIHKSINIKEKSGIIQLILFYTFKSHFRACPEVLYTDQIALLQIVKFNSSFLSHLSIFI